MPQHAEELLRFARRQHGRRLVEDQQADLAKERLENFYALLFAHGKLAHNRVGIDLQTVMLRQFRHAGAQFFARQEKPVAAIAQQDIVQHRHRVHEREMLVHHADARVNRRLRR